MTAPPAGVGEVVFTAAQIRGRVARLARRISQDYAGRELRLVTVLKGGIFFVAYWDVRLPSHFMHYWWPTMPWNNA